MDGSATGTDTSALKARALASLDAVAAEARELALRIHAHPEIGFEERRAAEWVSEALERHGYAVQRGAAGIGTAIVARAEGRRPGPTVGLIAEYDALPGIGHACGHNLIATAAVGAGLPLR
jgi:metal-dependent amidase/aminoacylase/carboxypeptidase family protein